MNSTLHPDLSILTETGNVLIIDDEPVIIEMLKVILDPDFTISCADKALDGLSLARAEQPDLILLDITMPEIDGYEMCRILKADQETKKIPVIFITSRSSAEDETRGLEAGAVDYITKPINPDIVRTRSRIHVELKKQRDYLEALSTLDALTGIPNRRFFNHSFDQELRRCKRAMMPLSVILLDIDYFKAYNDNYGHVAGDDCLRKVAKTLQAVPSRGGDFVARYGGEEFVVILPNTPLESLFFMAEKFRLGIEKAGIPHAFSSVSNVVTVSAGAATAMPDEQLASGELLQRVDNMLYNAKNSGRNRVCSQIE